MSRDRREKPLPITMKELGDPEYILAYVKECMRTIDDLIQERQREHAAIVRAVTRLQKEERVERASVIGYRVALTHVLALLAARKGRTR